MDYTRCDKCEKQPRHPDKKCCFNCGRDGYTCGVWHTCGEDCPGWDPREIQKGCEYCTGVVKTFPTHCDGEAYITKLTPLPAIDLLTGETAETADPPFFAIRITSDDMGEDFVPIRFCPKCGRELKED